MSTTIGIIVFDTVRTCEVIAPIEVFALASQREWFKGAQVLLIGVHAQPVIQTAEGLKISVDCTIANAPQVDVLIVPGAGDVSALLEYAPLTAFIQQHSAAADWTASFCAGAFLLGNAGALDGKQATTWRGGETELKSQFPQIDVQFNTPVVVDQRRVTANGGLVSYRASLILLAQLTSVAHAAEIYEALSLGSIGDWAGIEASLV